jgi:hypothetical protein
VYLRVTVPAPTPPLSPGKRAKKRRRKRRRAPAVSATLPFQPVAQRPAARSALLRWMLTLLALAVSLMAMTILMTRCDSHSVFEPAQPKTTASAEEADADRLRLLGRHRTRTRVAVSAMQRAVDGALGDAAAQGDRGRYERALDELLSAPEERLKSRDSQAYQKAHGDYMALILKRGPAAEWAEHAAKSVQALDDMIKADPLAKWPLVEMATLEMITLSTSKADLRADVSAEVVSAIEQQLDKLSERFVDILRIDLRDATGWKGLAIVRLAQDRPDQAVGALTLGRMLGTQKATDQTPGEQRLTEHIQSVARLTLLRSQLSQRRWAIVEASAASAAARLRNETVDAATEAEAQAPWPMPVAKEEPEPTPQPEKKKDKAATRRAAEGPAAD